MRKGLERCPGCDDILAERTNGTGSAYLECVPCDYVEAVVRKADPFPTEYRTYTPNDGISRRRILTRRPDAPHRHGVMGPRRKAS